MKKIAVIHTSLAIRERVDHELKGQISDVEIHNIIDEHMLQDVIDSGGINPTIVQRMCLYVNAAQSMGVDIILNACSSVGEAFDVARQQASIPTVRIDEPMAEQAVALGTNIAVYGTVMTTLAPSCELIKRTAEQLHRAAKVTPYLIDGAFKVLAEEKNPEKHNQMVLEKVYATHDAHDVIVLAQASMAILVPEMQGLEKPVLFNLESGIERIRSMLTK